MIVTIIKKTRTIFFTNLCKKTAKQYGKGLHVNLPIKRILEITVILMV